MWNFIKSSPWTFAVGGVEAWLVTRGAKYNEDTSINRWNGKKWEVGKKDSDD